MFRFLRNLFSRRQRPTQTWAAMRVAVVDKIEAYKAGTGRYPSILILGPEAARDVMTWAKLEEVEDGSHTLVSLFGLRVTIATYAKDPYGFDVLSNVKNPFLR